MVAITLFLTLCHSMQKHCHLLLNTHMNGIFKQTTICKQLINPKETYFVYSQHVYTSCVIPLDFIIEVFHYFPIPFIYWCISNPFPSCDSFSFPRPSNNCHSTQQPMCSSRNNKCLEPAIHLHIAAQKSTATQSYRSVGKKQVFRSRPHPIPYKR